MHLAHRLAFESPQVRADMVEATEYPHLVQMHEVRGVPKTIVNGFEGIEGAMPEGLFIQKILEALKNGKADDAGEGKADGGKPGP